MVIFGLFGEGEVTSDTIVILAVNQIGQPLLWKVPIKHQNGILIHKLAAYNAIQDLQENTENNIAKDKVTSLGVKYQLATKYTSFVVVEERDDQVVSDSLKTVPVHTLLPGKMSLHR